MSTIVRPNKTGGGPSYLAGNDVLADEFNADAETIYNDYNGNITNINCSASMGLVGTKLADAPNGIITAKINDKAVTGVKIANDATIDANRAVGTDHIKDGVVTTSKLVDASVTTPKLFDASVTAPKVAAGIISTDKFKNLVIETVAFVTAATSNATSMVMSRDTFGGNYRAMVFARGTIADNLQIITPISVIPTATKQLIGLYLDSVVYSGGQFSGNVILVSVDKA